MKYRNHFLSSVIFRIDFVQPIENMKESIDEKISSACLYRFPLSKPEIDISEKKVQVKQTETGEPQAKVSEISKHKEWRFSGRNNEKTLTISNRMIILELRQFSSFESFCDEYQDILVKLMEKYPQIKFKRIGLRYIDQIDLPFEAKRKTNWKTYWNKYIASDLVGNLAFQPSSPVLSRCLSSIEANCGDYMVRFQYGIFNPDYPAVNKKNNFILDTDVYTQGVMSMDELGEFLRNAHGVVNAWFEAAIKQPLREYMGVLADEK